MLLRWTTFPRGSIHVNLIFLCVCISVQDVFVSRVPQFTFSPSKQCNLATEMFPRSWNIERRRRPRGPTASPGPQEVEAVDVGLRIPFHYVSITARTHTCTHTSDPRTARSISESVTDVTCKNQWPSDVTGEASGSVDFKTANTRNVTFSKHIWWSNTVSSRGGGGHTEGHEPRGCF